LARASVTRKKNRSGTAEQACQMTACSLGRDARVTRQFGRQRLPTHQRGKLRGARRIDAVLLKRSHPLLSARFSAALHPLGVGLLALGTGAIPAFALLHGAGNGILTIARGAVPLAIYGPVNYGHRLGILGAPSRVAQAAAPLLFGVLIDEFGWHALLFSAALGLGALAAFCMIGRASAS
jgi:MFS family permease